MRPQRSAGRRARAQAVDEPEDRPAHNPADGPVDDTDQMASLELLGDVDLDQLVAGEVPPGRDDLVALSAALGALRARVDAEPVPPMTPGLRIQLAEADVDAAARARPGRLAVVPRAAEAGRPRWRGAVGASAAALVLVAGMTAAAVKDALPALVQDAVAASAHLVGIDLPRSDGRHGPSTGTPPDPGPAAPGSSGTPSRPADPPAHGRDGQPGASTREGSPSDDAPGQTGRSPADDAQGRQGDADPGTRTSPEPAVDPDRGDGPAGGDEPAGQGPAGDDDSLVPDPGDPPSQEPGGGGTPGGGTPGGGTPGGGGAGGGGPGGGGQSGPQGQPQPSGGGQGGGPTPMSGEGAATAGPGG